MTETYSFGEWMAQRRKSLDMTQRELAAQTNCALATIKKIETDERRPSRDLAEALAAALQIATDVQQKFIDCARGLRPVDVLEDAQAHASAGKHISVPQIAVDLPISNTSTIGRTSELAQIANLLGTPECRLLTLVGTGGIGKTRLALAAAHAQRDRFEDGAVFVPLAAVADASLIPNAIAHSLKLALSGSAEDQLLAYLRDKNLLLIVDNCEQVLEGISWLSHLLMHAPGIKLLATSRERLQLTEEWIFVVPVLEDAQAVEMFKHTARRLNPQFEGSDIGTLCAVVENLPLAIELAASWTPFLSCAQIAQNIRHDIDFLSANVRNIPERHRSIRAVFDYSWRLLTPAEQQVMMGLSVFRGGWTIDESQPVAGASLSLLRALAEKSLVRIIGQGRYDLHELIRQYAADQLRAAGQEAPVKKRHCLTYLALANQFLPEHFGANGIAAFARLDQEQDNLRAAMRWALDVGEIEIARRYVDALFLYWQRRGYWVEGEYWARATGMLAGEDDSPLLCWVLLETAVFIALQGRYGEAFEFKPRAEAMARRLEDPETMMRFFFIEGQATLDMTSAAAVWQEFFTLGENEAISAKLGAGKHAMIAGGHFLYGDRLRDAGHTEAAYTQYRQSLDLYRALGNVDLIAYPIGNLGRLALQEGRVAEAYNSFTQSVAISRAVGNRVGIADWLQQLGNAALAMGDLAQAESCYDEALAMYQEMANHRACPDIIADLGFASLVKGDLNQARAHFLDSLHNYHTFGKSMNSLGVGWSAMLPPEFKLCLQGLALLAVHDNHFDRAATLLSAAEVHQSKFGQGADLGMQARVEAALQTIQQHMTPTTFTKAWESGQSSSIEQIWALIFDT